MKVCDLKWGWLDIVKIKICWFMLGIGIGSILISKAPMKPIVPLPNYPPAPPKIIIT
jgi:hypothetical protein